MTDYLSHFKPVVRKNFDKLTAWLDFNNISYRTAFSAGQSDKRFTVIIEDRLLCLDNEDLEHGLRFCPWHGYARPGCLLFGDVAKLLSGYGFNLVKCTKNVSKRQKSLFDN